MSVPAFTGVFTGTQLISDHSQAEQKASADLYKAKWGWLPLLEADIATVIVMRSTGRLMHQNGLPNFTTVSPDRKGLEIVDQSEGIFHQMVHSYKATTALANHIAVGRKPLQGHLPLVGYGIRLPPLEFWREDGVKPGRFIGDSAHTARAYAHEWKWLNGLDPKWTEAAERWRSRAGFERSYTMRADTTDGLASHEGALEELKLEQVAEQLISDNVEKALIQTYTVRFKNFAKQWTRLLILTAPGHAAETCLAYTAIHLKLISAALRQAKKLVKASAEMEQLLGRVASAGVLNRGQAVVLPLQSFDPDNGKEYRDDLLKALEPHHSTLDIEGLMPQLLQRWQTDKLHKTVAALTFIEKAVRDWVMVHGDDPKRQGIHLDVKDTQ